MSKSMNEYRRILVTETKCGHQENSPYLLDTFLFKFIFVLRIGWKLPTKYNE